MKSKTLDRYNANKERYNYLFSELRKLKKKNWKSLSSSVDITFEEWITITTLIEMKKRRNEARKILEKTQISLF